MYLNHKLDSAHKLFSNSNLKKLLYLIFTFYWQNLLYLECDKH